jgi:hypothetical protein
MIRRLRTWLADDMTPSGQFATSVIFAVVAAVAYLYGYNLTAVASAAGFGLTFGPVLEYWEQSRKTRKAASHDRR